MVIKFNKATQLYALNYLSPQRININQGGTNSSKTYTVMQALCTHAICEPNQTITVVAQDVPNLKKGPWRDTKMILNNEPWLQMFMNKWNLTDRIIPFKNGSYIEFSSYKDAQDAKQGKRDYLFVTECQGITYDVFIELLQRTGKKAYLDFNPSAEFWVHEHLLNKDNQYFKDTRFIKSTILHNPFAPETIRRQVMAYEHTDPYRWKVYGLGELAVKEGVIFPEWEEVDDVPAEWDWVVSGIDFGFFNSPTTLIDVYKNGNNLYFDERIYQKDLLLRDLVKFIKDNYKTDHLFYADSAEPKQIAAMRREALYVASAVKGPDSISAGIDKLKTYKCHYTRRSANIRKERLNYSYAMVNDRLTNKPIDDWNHAIDAIRYGAYSHSFR
jgi:phage terminase large subunit